MRDDLLRLCLEKGRRGGGGRDKRAPRRGRWGEDDVAVPESMRRTHSVKLGWDRKQTVREDRVIVKELRAAVGRPWGKVRAALLHALAGGGTQAARVRRDALSLVAEATEVGMDGKRYQVGGWRRYEMRDGGFYVDDHGILRAYVAKPRAPRPPKPLRRVEIGGETYERIDGFWYHLGMEPRPRGCRWVVRVDRGREIPFRDKTMAEERALEEGVGVRLVNGWETVSCLVHGHLPFLDERWLDHARRWGGFDPTRIATAKRQISGDLRDRLGLPAA